MTLMRKYVCGRRGRRRRCEAREPYDPALPIVWPVDGPVSANATVHNGRCSRDLFEGRHKCPREREPRLQQLRPKIV